MTARKLSVRQLERTPVDQILERVLKVEADGRANKHADRDADRAAVGGGCVGDGEQDHSARCGIAARLVLRRNRRAGCSARFPGAQGLFKSDAAARCASSGEGEKPPPARSTGDRLLMMQHLYGGAVCGARARELR